jgi:hypothetical protein
MPQRRTFRQGLSDLASKRTKSDPFPNMEQREYSKQLQTLTPRFRGMGAKQEHKNFQKERHGPIP